MTTPEGHQHASTESFFQALFDWNFEKFIMRRAIKVVYIIAVVLIGLGGLAFFVAALSAGGGGALAAVIIVPLAGVLYIISIRLWLELVAIIFKISDDASAIRAALEKN